MHRLAWILVLLALAADAGAGSDARSLRFYHTHTGAELEIEFYRRGAYHPDALRELNEFLADFRGGGGVDMDPRLFDILFTIQERTGSQGVFEVISAYRSPETNEMLRKRSGGVARNSQHVHGKAIDVRLTDVDTKTLRDTALALGVGGVGYYRHSDFVHIDTGPVRSW